MFRLLLIKKWLKTYAQIMFYMYIPIENLIKHNKNFIKISELICKFSLYLSFKNIQIT